MKTKVGSPPDDPGRARRFRIALPLAVVITVLLRVALGLAPSDRTVADPTPARMEIVLERALPTPRPTPRPTPLPTPRPTPPATPLPIVHATLAPAQRAAPAIAHHAGGARPAPRLVPHAAHPTTFAAPLAPGGSGTSNVATTGSGTASGDDTGAGSSGGANGSGSGSVNADAPCGYVELVPFDSPDHSGGITYEHIRATVTFADAHKESVEFPYRWAYRDPDDDPWSPRNIRNDNFPTRVQEPPDRTSRGRLPDLIRYILDHSRSDGTTILQECPHGR